MFKYFLIGFFNSRKKQPPKPRYCQKLANIMENNGIILEKIKSGNRMENNGK